MPAFVRYQLISLVRSLKFIPPATLFLAWVFILYAYKFVPILSSYGVSSIAIYLTMSWMTMATFTLEEDSEKHILFSHLGSKVLFLLGKWISLMIVMIPILLYAIFFPIITESFKGRMTLMLYVFSFFSHFVFGGFGILVGTLFSATKLATKKYAWLSAVLFIVVSLASASIIDVAPIFKWIFWILPPVFKVLQHMEGGDSILLLDSLKTDIGIVMGYLIIGAVLNIFLYREKER